MDHRNTQILLNVSDAFNALADRFNNIVQIEGCDNDLYESQVAIIKTVAQQFMLEFSQQLSDTFIFNVSDDGELVKIVTSDTEDLPSFMKEIQYFAEDYFCLLFDIDEVKFSISQQKNN